MTNKFDFRLTRYFTGTSLFFGIILGFVAIFVFPKSILLGLGILLISLGILTTHYRLSIDFENKTLQDYIWIMGLKFGKTEQFEKIEYLFIKKLRVSQTMRLRVASTSYKKDVYDGYMRLSEKKKIHLFTLDSKEVAFYKLKKIASDLKTHVVEYSDGEAQKII